MRERLATLFKAKEFAINRPERTGLSKQQIEEVMRVLRSEKAKGNLPAMSFEYKLRPGLFGKGPIYVRPKNAELRRTVTKVRRILRGKFGSKYTVYID